MTDVPVPEFAKKPLEALRTIAMEKNNPIRTNNLYISSQLHRWLKWIAEMDENKAMTSDGLAESILRETLLGKYPSLEQLEADYWTARNKLDSETVNKLKEHAQSRPSTT